MAGSWWKGSLAAAAAGIFVTLGLGGVRVAAAAGELAQGMAAPPGGPVDMAAPQRPRSFEGPSLNETGRVAPVPEPVPPIAPGNTGTEPERSVQSANDTLKAEAAEMGAAPPLPQGQIDDPAGLEQEIEDHVGTLEDCRIDAARQKQVTPDQVEASSLLLRWTIGVDGGATSTEVVAIKPVDPMVMDCVKHKMNGWSFTPLRGGTLAVQRELTFHRVMLQPPKSFQPPVS
jgi:hypothetical protein